MWSSVSPVIEDFLKSSLNSLAHKFRYWCRFASAAYQKDGSIGWQGLSAYFCFNCFWYWFCRSLWALNFVASWGVRLLRISASCFACCSSICFLIASLVATAGAAPFGLTKRTAGSIPILIRRPPVGTSVGPRTRWLCSSTGQPNFAIQLFKCRKLRSAIAESPDFHSLLTEARSSSGSDRNCWTSTPSGVPSTGVSFSICNPASVREAMMYDFALFVSASKGWYSINTSSPANGRNGSTAVVSPGTEGGGGHDIRRTSHSVMTLGALQTAKFLSDFSNSARLASTPSNFVFADWSSRSSCAACSDTASAFVLALPASTPASFADCWARAALCSAVPACCVMSASNWLLLLRKSEFLLRNSDSLPRNLRFIEATSTPTASSPAIPSPISRTLAISTRRLVNDGLAGDRNTPKYVSAHVSTSSCHSCRITHSSSTTPAKTKNVKTKPAYSQDEVSKVLISLSSANMALSRAEMELSKAEGSVGRLEAAWIRGAKITIALFLVPIGYAA